MYILIYFFQHHSWQKRFAVYAEKCSIPDFLQNFFVKSDSIYDFFFLYFFSTVHDKKCSAVYEDKCTTELVEECHSEIKEPSRFTLIYMFYPAGEVVKTCEKVPRKVNKNCI